jgi:L-Ala-D/L-Glu epimerase
VRLEVGRVTLRLRAPWESSYGAVVERELVQLTLTDSDGVQGHGEAAPLEPYDGVSVARVQRALGRYEDVLSAADRVAGREASGHAVALEACRRLDDLPQALAAVDLALWDLAGKRAGKPLAQLLADDAAPAVAVCATIATHDRQAAAQAAARAVQDGFGCLKLKVGMDDDAARVAAVREAAGSRTALRLDANGAWTVAEAVSAIETLSRAGLELVEEPTHGLEGIAEVCARVSARVAIDETAADGDALSEGVADAVCLKLGRCGGVLGLLAAAGIVRASGREAYVGSTLDGPLGVAGALHAAAALAVGGPLAPCGLATLGLFADLDDPLPVRDGAIAVPSQPGLGLDPPGPRPAWPRPGPAWPRPRLAWPSPRTSR